jgi:hypothetical protein
LGGSASKGQSDGCGSCGRTKKAASTDVFQNPSPCNAAAILDRIGSAVTG